MNAQRRSGFTLIELLTVIAIIAILAGFIAVAAPRALERAKLRRMQAAMIDIRTAMTVYYTEHNSYPPAYGYVPWDMRDESPESINDDNTFYFLQPYTALLRIHGNEGLYDEFSESYDTNRDGQLSLLEFLPIGEKNLATQVVTFPTTRYTGSNLPNEVAKQLEATRRPFVYIPVNSRQFKRARQYWIETGDFLATTWDPANPTLRNITFPPSDYDAFVLISVGPGGSTFGLLPDPIGTEPPKDLYHITALRAFFLATRDLNDNGQLDFHFVARSQQGEAKFNRDNPYQVSGAPAGRDMAHNELPDPRAPNGYGPFIFAHPERL